ncbi:MAG: MFS transporter [Tissierellia bacterium]|nr:MFS transporter [Tissierellia bacterium]
MKKDFRPFILLWLGQVLASLGSGLSTFGLGVYAFSLAQSALDSSLVLLLGFLPSLLLLVPSGVLADTYDRRLLMILGDGLSGLGILFILLVKVYGQLTLAHIYIGVFISSLFSSLMEPAYRASVTDLLDKEDYTKASGLVQLASSAKFLLSPLLGGLLLKHYDLEVLLGLDIASLFVTLSLTFAVRKSLKNQTPSREGVFVKDLATGWALLRENKGVYSLALAGGGLTFFIGLLQALAGPYILSAFTQDQLGLSLSLSALGMVFGGLALGLVPLKKNFLASLSASLLVAGLAMASYGFYPSFIRITLSGFLFFASLPLANASMDYLVRAHIPGDFQGRIWAFMGLISQMGYVLAYPLAGFLADQVFSPALETQGALAETLGLVLGTGPGRGMGLLIILGALGLMAMGLGLWLNQDLRQLDALTQEGDRHDF